MAQVAAGTGGVGVFALACMVITTYTLVATVLAGIVAALRCISRARALDDPGVLGMSLALWTLIVVGGYLNFVHLPEITAPITIVVNLALLVGAAWLWFFMARSELATRVAARGGVAIAVAGFAALSVLLLARPHPSGDDAMFAQTAEGPNVIVVVVDSLRFDQTGVGGGSATPNIDRLSAQGTTFVRAYAQASWTKPSVASLFTSLYPSSHGANFRRDRLSDQPQTIAEAFQHAGYRTGVFSANPWISPAFGFDRGVMTFVESERETFERLVILLRLLKLPDRLLPVKPVAAGLKHLEGLFGLAHPRLSNCDRDVVLIEEFKKWLASNSDRPAFAYLHLMSPHIPYDPPGGPHPFSNQDQVALLRSSESLPTQRRELLVDLYARTVAHGDSMIGRIMTLLDELGFSDSTILVVTADHGEEFFEHGHWGHGKSLYDELIHVPLVMRGPNVAAGKTDRRTAMLVDVAPTLAMLADVPTSAAIAGSPLAGTVATPRTAYAELLREGGMEMYMVYQSGMKYLESTVGLGQELKHELYDVNKDPLETLNLASATVADWHARLSRLREDARRTRVAASTAPDIDSASEERLRALGYIN